MLLKLEAGSAADELDLVEFVGVRRALDGAPWLADVSAHLPRLSMGAQAAWVRVEALLAGRPPA